MRLLVLLALLVAACDGGDSDVMTTASDAGVFSVGQAVVTPPPVRILEDKRLNENATFFNAIVKMSLPGLDTYFLGGPGSGQIYFTWQYFLPGLSASPMPVGSPAKAAPRALVDYQAVATGQYGCFLHACTVTMFQPMAGSAVFHTDDSFPRDWWPTGVTKPEIRPPSPQVRKQYRFRCPGGSFSQPLGVGPWIDLGTAPDTVVINDWTQEPLYGVFGDPNTWQGIATFCGVGAGDFSPSQVLTCRCDMPPSQVEYCQWWPNGGSCAMDPASAASCHARCGK